MKACLYREKIMTMSPFVGFVGLVILSVCLAISTYSFTDYSFLNHFISELGTVSYSPFWYVFSLGICIAGVCFSFTLLGFGIYLNNRWAKVGLIIGGISGISTVMVGLFPADVFTRPHLIAASLFFMGNFISTLFFCLGIYMSRKTSKKMLIPFSISVCISFCFLVLPTEQVKQFLSKDPAFVRPDIWINPLVEWMVLWAIMGLVCTVSYYMFVVHRSRKLLP